MASADSACMVKCAVSTYLLAAVVFCSPSNAAEDKKPQAAPLKTDATASLTPTTESEIATLKTSLALDPGNASLHTRLGYLLLQKNSLDEARASFEQALKLNPRAHDAMTGKGIVLRRQGNLAEAERVLKDALHLNPNPVRTHYELGLVYEQLGMPDKALAEFKEGILKHEQGR